MKRWFGFLSVRWGVALAAAWLVLIAGWAKFRVVADEAKEASPRTPATAKREALRYAGKNFEQWRVELQTELKPEIRMDGITAFGAFGANGYGAEATQTIVDLMKGYDLDADNSKDKDVINAAVEAVAKIGAPAIPVLWERLHSDNSRIRRFASECLRPFDTDWHPPVAELLKALQHEDRIVRNMALGFLNKVKNKPKKCVPILLECLKDKESEVRANALRNLDDMRPEAKEVMSALSVALTDSDWTVRSSAIYMAGRYGAQAKPVAPELLKALDKPLGSGDFEAIMDALAAIGPDAKDALPKLRQLQEKPNMEVFSVVGCPAYGKILDRTIKKIADK